MPQSSITLNDYLVMKRLLILLPLLLITGFAWLAVMERPAPVAEVRQTIPADRITER